MAWLTLAILAMSCWVTLIGLESVSLVMYSLWGSRGRGGEIGNTYSSITSIHRFSRNMHAGKKNSKKAVIWVGLSLLKVVGGC